jgi:hypothetical protein
MIVMAMRADGNRRFSTTKNKRSTFVSWTPTAHRPLQHNHLMSECRVLCLKSALRLERWGEQGEKEAEQRDHRRRGLGDSVTQSICMRVSVHTRVAQIGSIAAIGIGQMVA